MSVGKVYLVGAGPGDPGLLTVRGAELLGRAEVVVHDRLASARLLDLAPASAERIDVGKAPGRVAMNQAAIDALLTLTGEEGLPMAETGFYYHAAYTVAGAIYVLYTLSLWRRSASVRKRLAALESARGQG